MPQVFQLDQWSKTLHPKYDHQVRYSLDKCVVVPQQKQVSASSQCSPPTAFYTSQKQTSWPKYVHWYSDEREEAEFLISSSKSSAFSSSDCFLSEQTSSNTSVTNSVTVLKRKHERGSPKEQPFLWWPQMKALPQQGVGFKYWRNNEANFSAIHSSKLGRAIEL